jgi:hypothetical protein
MVRSPPFSEVGGGRFPDAGKLSEIDLLRKRKGVVHFDPEISHGALEFAMVKQELARAAVACLLVNQRQPV